MSVRRQVYLDYAATTPLDERVFDAMVPFLKEHYGNASSVHGPGRKARFAVEESREKISALLGVAPGEVIFTSGGTESNNAALKGSLKSKAGTIVTSIVEHEAILTQAKTLLQSGHAVKLLPPTGKAQVSFSQIAALPTDELAIISCMHVNNEVGSISDVGAIGEYCAANDIIFHTDAVQSAGWFDLKQIIDAVDLVSISAHKFYGPKGVGMLVATRNAALAGLIEGGSQERRRRGGTENVAGIVGMAKAFELSVLERDHRVSHLESLKRRLIAGLSSTLDAYTYVVNTPEEQSASAPHIVNIAFPQIDNEELDGEMLILNLDMEGVYVSSGSACTSGTIEPSHVLLGMGLDKSTASSAVRFSLGKDTSEADIDYAIDKLQIIVKRMRGKVNV